MKQTFMEFLTEDTSDLELIRHKNDKDADTAEYSKAANEFKNSMDADRNKDSGSQPNEPNKGDVIKSGEKQFVVVRRHKSGFEVKELGATNKKNQLIKHGVKYAKSGKTALGKTVFKVGK